VIKLGQPFERRVVDELALEHHSRSTGTAPASAGEVGCSRFRLGPLRYLGGMTTTPHEPGEPSGDPGTQLPPAVEPPPVNLPPDETDTSEDPDVDEPNRDRDPASSGDESEDKPARA